MVGLRREVGEGERNERWGIFPVKEGGCGGFVVGRWGSKGSEKEEELGLLERCDWGVMWELVGGLRRWWWWCCSRAAEGRPATLREETEVDKDSMT